MVAQLKALFIAAEAEPFVKIGGLGDVAGSLPQAIRRQGNVDIRLVIPFHRVIQAEAYDLDHVATFSVKHTSGPIEADVFATEIEGLTVYLVAGSPITQETTVYTSDAAMDGYKYTFFSLAALQLARNLDWYPDVIHANDWHTAPAVYALSLIRDQESQFKYTATLLGLHNLPYLGVGAGAKLLAFDLPPASNSALPWWAQDLPLPLGLLSADHIVAVSPTYAKEILTPEFGSGLDAFLQTRADSISGILNGIDTTRWNPANDEALCKTFSLNNLAPRQTNKEDLQKEIALEVNADVPLLAMITRLDPQKGVDLIPPALEQLVDENWQFIVLGTGVTELEQEMRWLQAEFPSHVRAEIRYNFELSRRIYAGADALLIPSRYEPCGLTQMIAMHYGCVPIARATGGLRDTIYDYAKTDQSTGFHFEKANAAELARAIQRSLSVYQDKDEWLGLMRRGMSKDFSWDRSARQYLELYHQLAASRREV